MLKLISSLNIGIIIKFLELEFECDELGKYCFISFDLDRPGRP